MIRFCLICLLFTCLLCLPMCVCLCVFGWVLLVCFSLGVFDLLFVCLVACLCVWACACKFRHFFLTLLPTSPKRGGVLVTILGWESNCARRRAQNASTSWLELQLVWPRANGSHLATQGHDASRSDEPNKAVRAQDGVALYVAALCG